MSGVARDEKNVTQEALHLLDVFGGGQDVEGKRMLIRQCAGTMLPSAADATVCMYYYTLRAEIDIFRFRVVESVAQWN